MFPIIFDILLVIFLSLLRSTSGILVKQADTEIEICEYDPPV